MEAQTKKNLGQVIEVRSSAEASISHTDRAAELRQSQNKLRQSQDSAKNPLQQVEEVTAVEKARNTADAPIPEGRGESEEEYASEYDYYDEEDEEEKSAGFDQSMNSKRS